MDPLIEERIKKLKELRALKINPYPYKYNVTHKAEQVKNSFAGLKEQEHTNEAVSIAGRLMTKREMGKICFATVQDQTGNIQVLAKEDSLKDFKLFTKLDLGDIIGVKGTIFKTKTGEVTVEIKEYQILAKSIRPLPEKFHGIKDPEVKYRQRYAHLATDKKARDDLIIRSKIVSEMRKILEEKGFIEFETPVLQPQYGGANARPFMTHHNTLNFSMYLRIATELYLKRLIVGGFEKVFEIGKDFRNEGIDHKHNPEFTMIELYQAYADYSDMMELTEELYERIAKKVLGTTKIKYGNHVIDLKRPWRRQSVVDAIKQHTNIGDVTKLDDDEIKDILRNYNINYEGDYIRGNAIMAIFDELVEDKLIQPTFITDHPRETTPLCKVHRKNPAFAERFEPFIAGMEIGNAYSELNDPIDQKLMLEAQAHQLRAGSLEAHPMDEDFINAIEIGMPPTGGIGLGIDRMAMLFTNNESIRDIIAFPTMKPKEFAIAHEKNGKSGVVVENVEGKSKTTMMAVAIVNKGLKLKPWQEMDTIAHLNAAFGARRGKSLLTQDIIKTKDEKEIKLNIQHAIMIKEAKSTQEILALIEEAKQYGLEVAEFTREMLETADDRKIIALTKEKKQKEIEFLGVLVFGPKKIVEKLTEKFKLYS